jgi:glycosyltransferase involved in cell wall biosynthesis
LKSLTIIVPTRNAGKYLDASLRSIDIDETIEVFVVDNLSDDNTAEIAKKNNCRFLSEPDRLKQLIRAFIIRLVK